MNELEIKEYELPKLEIIDYDKYLKMAEEDTKKYQKYIVTSDSLEDDTKKRAELRKVAKTINDRRLAIEKEITAPVKEFKAKCDAIITLYTDSANLIDKQIKVFEEKEKEERKLIAKKIYEVNIEELKDIVPFEKLFNDKWLNKGYWDKDGSSKKIVEEIEKAKQDIRTGLNTIESLNTEFELEIKSTFLSNFDLASAIQKNNELIEQRNKLVKTAEIKEEIKETKVEEMLTKPVEKEEEDNDPVMSYTLKLTGRKSKLVALRKFIELNEIKFEKVG